ncbi:MAG: YggT family protein [Gammaproteobacteria bacterium]|nr:YggT family protein [Gammaproteobacteria bacterium]
MGSGYLLNPLMLLINTVFDLYIMLVLLRFMLQAFRADFYNQVSQFVVKATTPPLKYLRRFIPSVGGHDTAAIVLAVMLITLKLLLLESLGVPFTDIAGVAAPITSVSILGLLVIAFAELLALALNIFLFAVIIIVILSWVSPGAYNPITQLIQSIANPVMGPIQRVMPNLGGLDLSPLVATLAIMLAKMIIIPPIIYFATLF